MASETFLSITKEEAQKAYSAIFERSWSVYLAGIFIALLALLIFLWDKPWGIAAGYMNMGDWLLYAVGLGEKKPFTMWLHPVAMSNIGILVGAFMSALLSRQFKLRQAPVFEYGKGLVGGLLMGVGAALAKGCNVGGFFTATGMLSLGGIGMMVGLGVGAWVGLRYLLWEMEHVNIKPVVAKEKGAPFLGVNWNKVQPYLGGAVFFAVIAGFYLYSSFDKAVIGGLLFLGMLIGLTMHRSRFCFVRAFRCPYMTGEAEMVKVVAMSLLIYGLGSAAIKYAWIQDPMTGVIHPFAIGSVAGGLIFGVGMILAGGCASSTLWRVGEGHLKLVFTFVAFAISNSLAQRFLAAFDLKSKLGSAIFIPDVLSWNMTIPVFILFFLSWVIIAIWNERTEKLVIF